LLVVAADKIVIGRFGSRKEPTSIIEVQDHLHTT
jgi:hypothetical protein